MLSKIKENEKIKLYNSKKKYLDSNDIFTVKIILNDHLKCIIIEIIYTKNFALKFC